VQHQHQLHSKQLGHGSSLHRYVFAASSAPSTLADNATKVAIFSSVDVRTDESTRQSFERSDLDFFTDNACLLN
jgi:hypothetical protein